MSGYIVYKGDCTHFEVKQVARQANALYLLVWPLVLLQLAFFSFVLARPGGAEQNRLDNGAD
jgi:hypothetical protein